MRCVYDARGNIPHPGAYNVHRWYEPGTGRYARTDPLGLSDPEDFDESYFNLYQYATANPLLNTDPNGLLTLPWSPDTSDRCRKKWRRKILPRLHRLTTNSDCTGYFCEKLKTDLPALLNDALPFIAVTRRSGGAFQCEPSLFGRRPDIQFQPRGAFPVIEVGRNQLCGSHPECTPRGLA